MSEMPDEIYAWESETETDHKWESGHIQAWERAGEEGDGSVKYVRADLVTADTEIRRGLAERVCKTIEWIIDGEHDWTTDDELSVLRDVAAYLHERGAK